MKWYQITASVLVMAATLSLCGCGGTGKGVAQTNKSLSLCVDDMTNRAYGDSFEEFKKTYPDVELNVEVYTDTISGMAKVNTQLLAGEGPDLILMTNYGTSDVYKMMKAQAFAPLDEFLEQDDGWEAGDYAQAVLDAGVYEEKQMVMPLGYIVQAAVTSQQNLDSAGISLDSCDDMLTFLQETSKFYELDSAERVLGDVGQLLIFPEFLSGQFLDYGKGSLDVDDQTLERACTAYKSFYYEDTSQNSFSLPEDGFWGIGEAIANGETCMVVPIGISNFMAVSQAVAANATPVLWPLKNGNGEIIAKVTDYAGIRANSENCQNAWNMLKILMSETGQSKDAAGRGNYCPVLKSALEDSIDQIKEEALESGKSMVEMAELPENLLARYKDALMKPDKAVFITDICAAKFLGYMQPFYEDQDSYENCVAEFRKFINIYLTE